MLCVSACVDYHACALEADCQRLACAHCCEMKEALWHRRGGDRSIGRSFAGQGRYIGRAEQFGQVGRVDWCCFDPDDNLVRSWSRELPLLDA
jgi:hypothetical protein